MAGIADFISMATEQLGIGGAEARGGAGALLGVLKDSVDADQFARVKEALPDVEETIAAAPSEEDSGGGGLGGLLGQASQAVGGGSVLGALQKVIPTDKLGSFASLFVNFLKEKLPGDLVQGLLSKLGPLKGLLG